MEDDAAALIKRSYDALGLSGRTFDKILKVARTIADMDESDIIKREHIFEALTYKNVNI
jgi:magnesium chelatase family protein